MNNQLHTRSAGSLPSRWALRTYDVWGNAKDGWEVNDTRDAGEVALRIPQTRYNVGLTSLTYKCRDIGYGVESGHCFGEWTGEMDTWGKRTFKRTDDVLLYLFPDEITKEESQEFVGAAPSDRQIKRAFGVTCRIETDGDDTHIEVNRARDGYPIGEMTCVSHESLSPVRAKAEVK